MLKRDTVFLILMLILASFLRFWQLSSVPPSLSWDEVAIGYNAYSILKTGNDEYGVHLPLLFRSFDDYKLPGMIYTVAISEKIFGLNEFAVRLPSTLFGILTVLVGYLLLKEILNKKAALFGSLMLAINPWLVNFSRQCFESNVSMFFVLLGVYLLIKVQKQRVLFIAAVISLAVSVYFYYATRLVVPFLGLIFLITNFHFVKKNLRIFLQGCFLGFLILLPLLPQLFSNGGFSRINQVAINSDPFYLSKEGEFAKKILSSNNSLLAKIFFNRRLALAEAFLNNYFKNLSFDFVFASGTGSMGLLYLWEMPFLILGLIYLIRLKGGFKWLLLTWLLTYPIASSLTKDQPNALRTLIGAPILSMTSFFGLYSCWQVIKKFRQKYIILALFTLLLVVSLIRFIALYFNYSTNIKALAFGDGYKQLAQYIKKYGDSYDEIWISGTYWRPYIHLLFHLQYDPLTYQKSGNLEHFDKLYFGKANWDKNGIDLASYDLNKLKMKKTLFILSSKDYYARIERNEKFTYEQAIDGLYEKKVFWVVEL